MQKDYDLKSIYNITSKNFSLSKYKVEIMGIYERIIYLVIGNALKSTSSMYSYLARISTYIGTYHLTLIRCRKCNWSHVSSILTVPTKFWLSKLITYTWKPAVLSRMIRVEVRFLRSHKYKLEFNN